ncbi:MAG: hypothetical protein AAGC60_25760 [Acidobacteriota bacterium]
MPSSRPLLGSSVRSIALTALVVLCAGLLAAPAMATSCYRYDPLDLTARYVPVQPPQSGTNNQTCTYELFAWQTFVALQWPAVVPTSQNGFKRGFPDPNETFTSQADPELPVWQTWKAKREIFRGVSGSNGGTPGAWNSQINYGSDLSGSNFPICAGADTTAVRQALRNGLHAFSMSSKVNSEDLDESLEVVGEAYFPSSVRGQRAEPQLYKTSSGQSVIYEVKLNYDWFNYVVTEQQYYDAAKRRADALAGNISFPSRTDSYDPANCSNSTTTPCPTGAIETKSAWVLHDGEDLSKYHTTEALYYKDDPTQTSGVCADLGTFLLVGFHIIQKTANQPFYVYATWGHRDNAANNNEFSYQNVVDGQPVPPSGGYGVGYITSTTTDGSGEPHYGATRIAGRTDYLNALVQLQIRGANPNSVWQHYQLVGTQFLPVNSTATSGSYPIGYNDPQGLGQSFYLANLTLETNWGLQNFQGQPPGIGNSHFPISNRYRHYLEERCIDAPIFQRDCVNTINDLNSTAYNAGGCMGCHGISQQLGYDFSFVLLRGGGGIETTPHRESFPFNSFIAAYGGIPVQSTCKECVLSDPYTLSCQCQNNAQQYVEATLDYATFSQCTGSWTNQNGQFHCQPWLEDEEKKPTRPALDRPDSQLLTDTNLFRFPLRIPQGSYLQNGCYNCSVPRPGTYACTCPPDYYGRFIDLSTCSVHSDGFYHLRVVPQQFQCE